ncbi:uncharacterized protein KY384_000834 [Bacidia gigantensis]|uniref:uncharacterized protein n=1 Tax=Bacidia gigantensis TaxID=2732470 RepID=UPI001D03A9D7|nr:uncharacterized protein KY384_000834 [Bacidia gigantensis]KAG8533992.1 hypothetical protein KY384_000834 [Bacidia gigantensis]
MARPRVPIARLEKSDSMIVHLGDRESSDGRFLKYIDRRYPESLAVKGSHMGPAQEGLALRSREWCKTLKTTAQTVPTDTIFRDDLFHETCFALQDRNKARVAQDIGRLIVPSAETLAQYGATQLNNLIENINERWSAAISFEGPLPQPDYAVGFRPSAFSAEQMKRLHPLLGDPSTDASFFGATSQMLLPFLTSRMTSGAEVFEAADRKNAHDMTVAVRGVVELFRVANREAEINREILAFSVLIDGSHVTLYGHYALINGPGTAYYRHTIDVFDFAADDGANKWTSYKFVKNIYELWMPMHLKRIASAIDQIPLGIEFSTGRFQAPITLGPPSSHSK